jgi:hypothetical protein
MEKEQIRLLTQVRQNLEKHEKAIPFLAQVLAVGADLCFQNLIN